MQKGIIEIYTNLKIYIVETFPKVEESRNGNHGLRSAVYGGVRI